MKKEIKILAIESSCDETAASVIVNGRKCLSNIISSQIDIHTLFGGVVPEVASRNHIMAIDSVVNLALKEANCTLKDIDAIAVTYGAGLIGSLLVGVSYAKALAYATKKPLIAVNHINGHIASNYLTYPELTPPFICLLVSGGHTAIIKVDEYNKHTVIGTTLDDAIGESYDKIARVLGLGYPGGPKVDKESVGGRTDLQFYKSNPSLGFNFSFSGKKTAIINYIHTLSQRGEEIPVKDICASFQHIAVEELATKTISACKKFKQNKLVLAGGVAANKHLRQRLLELGKQNNISVYLPEMVFCTDNAAMIGSSAYYSYIAGENIADMTLAPAPGLSL